jgi:hypothetical protein
MKTLVFTAFIFAMSSVCFAQDSAEVMKRNGEILVQYGDQLLSPTEVIPVNTSVDIYVVRSGDVGTSVIITVYRGIIWDKKNSKVLGMFPYKYAAKGDPGYRIDQPEWNIENKRIQIKDINLELVTTIDL